mgnify:CR=1 FL=1
MQITPEQARVLAAQALQALRSGQTGAAEQAYVQLTRWEGAGADDWVGLAYARAQAGKVAEAQQALDAALQCQPNHLRALLLKADLFASQGQDREAAATYRLLPRAAQGQQLPPSLQQELARAASLSAQYEAKFAALLEERLQARLQSSGGAGRRFGKALDLLMGRRALYESKPRLFHFPELVSRTFWDPAEFDWVPALERHTEVIRAELQELLKDRELPFHPYLERTPGRAVLKAAPLLDNLDWGACYLWRDGERNEAIAQRCPQTMAALQAVPLPQCPGRAPNVLFSLLRPGVHIPPHHGVLNTRLIGHLPLVVPPGCRIRVGADTHEWQEGRVVIFDDSIEHEAWNPSEQLRVILLFEIWRPELNPLERELVNEVFMAIGGQQGEERL